MDKQMYDILIYQLQKLESKVDKLQTQQNRIAIIEAEIKHIYEMKPKLDKLERANWKKIGALGAINAIITIAMAIIFGRK